MSNKREGGPCVDTCAEDILLGYNTINKETSWNGIYNFEGKIIFFSTNHKNGGKPSLVFTKYLIIMTTIFHEIPGKLFPIPRYQVHVLI